MVREFDRVENRVIMIERKDRVDRVASNAYSKADTRSVRLSRMRKLSVESGEDRV